jgi:uncharacterized alpha/beta hydrolase family protein
MVIKIFIYNGNKYMQGWTIKSINREFNYNIENYYLVSDQTIENIKKNNPFWDIEFEYIEMNQEEISRITGTAFLHGDFETFSYVSPYSKQSSSPRLTKEQLEEMRRKLFEEDNLFNGERRLR